MVIDTSKGLQSSDFSAFEMSDVILVVVQLDLICLRNTARLLGLFREYDGLIDRVKLVVNRSGSWECQISPKKAEETLKMPISWQIPNAAKAFQEARLKGVPLAEVAKGSRPHQVFLEMARSLRPSAAEDSIEAAQKGCSPRSFESGSRLRCCEDSARSSVWSDGSPLGSAAGDRRARAAAIRPRPSPGSPRDRAGRRAAARATAAAAAQARAAQGSSTRPRSSTRRSSGTSTCGWSTGST